MSIKASASSELGRLLLKGWAMLAEHCPDCQVPLMRNPVDKSLRLCVNCERRFKDGQLDIQQRVAPEDLDGAEVGPEAGADDYDARWDPRIGPFAVRASQEPEPAPPASQPAASGKSEHKAQPEGRRKSDEVADMISEYLVKGWALLDDCCPRCSTVLIRNKQKRKLCVECNAWIMSEAEASEAATQLDSFNPSSAAASASNGPAATASPAAHASTHASAAAASGAAAPPCSANGTAGGPTSAIAAAVAASAAAQHQQGHPQHTSAGTAAAPAPAAAPPLQQSPAVVPAASQQQQALASSLTTLPPASALTQVQATTTPATPPQQQQPPQPLSLAAAEPSTAFAGQVATGSSAHSWELAAQERQALTRVAATLLSKISDTEGLLARAHALDVNECKAHCGTILYYMDVLAKVKEALR